jgi:CheY-like chemotaxis protein
MGQRLRLLLVEDEMLAALNLEDMVIELGHEVAALATRLETALDHARTLVVDCAVLDINLGGKQCFPVADALADRGIPCLFATGYGIGGLDAHYAEAVVLQKPYRLEDLERAIRQVVRDGPPPVPG